MTARHETSSPWRNLELALADLNLGALRYFAQLGSTNDEAARWAEEGAPDMTLVLADEQTSGRGRSGRRWYTPAGTGLAFSLILRTIDAGSIPPRLTALGALAVCSALEKDYGLVAQIKWPNDVLLNERKAAGVLAEAHWDGDSLQAVILGIGINVSPESIQAASLQPGELSFPATCLETVCGRSVERLELLRAVVAELIYWKARLRIDEFFQAWESRLAFRGEWVRVFTEPGAEALQPTDRQADSTLEGQILGLTQDGGLKLRTSKGDIVVAQAGDLHLRMV
jgi:BirA family biotin operon repressor/biotin-[acetyl-CoA-carboxylase] ligase